MNQDLDTLKKETKTRQNWISTSHPAELENIHEHDVNIAIYNREITALSKEINQLISRQVEIKVSGSVKEILTHCSISLDQAGCPTIKKDIEELLLLFQQVSTARTFKLCLVSLHTDLCRRFHTDMNDLRMLCTYSGPGTLWLKEDNVDREALHEGSDNEPIALDEQMIQQAKTGDVVVLKGAIYPKEGTKAAVHRSPAIEESGERRLLLRIDTNEFLNF